MKEILESPEVKKKLSQLGVSDIKLTPSATGYDLQVAVTKNHATDMLSEEERIQAVLDYLKKIQLK